MSNKTRKHIWPLSLVMSVAIIGALAAFIVLGSNPGDTMAHDDADHAAACAAMTDQEREDHNAGALLDGSAVCLPPDDSSGGTGGGGDNMMEDGPPVVSSSSSGSATVELKLTVTLTEDVPVGGAFVLYLEDDFQEPDSISANDVYFVSMPPELETGNGSRVYATQAPEIETDSHFTPDKSDIDIRVSVPDMCTNATDECEGANGLSAGDTVTMVIQKSAGIKNPSEAGSHSTGYAILGPTDNVPSGPSGAGFMKANELATVAKISLSDVDNSRGYEMTVTGSAFNNGTSAGVYVLHIPGTEPGNAHRNAYLWNALDCDEMIAAVPSDAAGNTGTGMSNPYCAMYNANFPQAQKDVVNALDFSKGDAEKQLCAAIVRSGTKVGGAIVGSDDKVAVTFEVTAPTFGPGQTNHICMVDGEGRMSNTDVEDFNLESSIKVVPNSVNSGDTVNVFAQDYQNNGQGFTSLKIGGGNIPASFIQSSRGIGQDGSGSVTFEVPGGLEGTLRIDALWGQDTNGNGSCQSDEPTCVTEDSKITIAGADLSVSKTEALPNETLTITGNGFGSQTCIPVGNVTLDNVAVMVDEESLGGNCANNQIEVSNSGQFVATIILWPAGGQSGANPTLIAGTHELSVEDTNNYSSSVDITISEPTVNVTPDVAGPRDYITITGENWPVDNPDGSISPSITIEVSDNANARTYTVFADGVGRITQEHRVHRNVSIPSDVQVKMSYGDVSKIGSFAVPASTIEVSPSEGQPGDQVTLTAGNMKVYTEVDYVEIGGSRQDNPGVNTDRDGNVTVEDVLIPGLDPGVYSVVINVDGTIAIGEINVLAESSAVGAPAALPGAVEALGDNLDAIFFFDNVGKEWSFYDPRPEFAELNTLTELVNGQPYWILVKDTVTDVVLNNKVVSLTCSGDDCWNLKIW